MEIKKSWSTKFFPVPPPNSAPCLRLCIEPITHKGVVHKGYPQKTVNSFTFENEPSRVTQRIKSAVSQSQSEENTQQPAQSDPQGFLRQHKLTARITEPLNKSYMLSGNGIPPVKKRP